MVRLGDPDSVFETYILDNIQNADRWIAYIPDEITGKNYGIAEQAIEIAKIHLYAARVLLSNWREKQIVEPLYTDDKGILKHCVTSARFDLPTKTISER